MNILLAAEAVKAGKKVRRPGWSRQDYYWHGENKEMLHADDILATDWEIEERKIEITEGEFDEACEAVFVNSLELKKRLFERPVK